MASKRIPARSSVPQQTETTVVQRAEITLEDAYSYDGDARLDLEKAIRCSAFLLQWGSEVGNQPIDGWFAHGLSALLHKAADETKMLFSVDEVYKAGGKPFVLRPVTKKDLRKDLRGR